MIGSYPTYEEWKLSDFNVVITFFSVLILPMRNGNFLSKPKEKKEETVLILPMRNGNQKNLYILLFLPISSQFLSYL